MKFYLSGAASLSLLALPCLAVGGCGLFGMGASETPATIAAAPAALPPPVQQSAPPPPPATPAPPAEPEPDLSGQVPVSEMKCIPTWTLKEVKLPDGKTEMRCSPP